MTEIIWTDDDGDVMGDKPVPTRKFGELIAWNGGECPVHPKTIVTLHFRGRMPYIGEAIWPKLPDKAKAGMWRHAPWPGRNDPSYDIIAYQVEI